MFIKPTICFVNMNQLKALTKSNLLAIIRNRRLAKLALSFANVTLYLCSKQMFVFMLHICRLKYYMYENYLKKSVNCHFQTNF